MQLRKDGNSMKIEGMTPIKRDCLNLILKKLNNELTKDQFYLALYDLDKKYPIKGHWPPLGKETMRNYRELDSLKILKTFTLKNDYGNEYKAELRESIRPLNFKESADFYMHHSQKVDEDPDARKPFKIPLNLKLKIVVDDPQRFEENRKELQLQAEQLRSKNGST